MTKQSTPSQNKGRITLLIIIGIFAIPLAVAWIWSANTDQFQPSGTTNKGTLIEPPRPISLDDSIELAGFAAEDPLRRIWTLIYVANQDCDSQCQDRIYRLRQVRMALGPQRMDRVQGLLLNRGPLSAATQAVLDKDHQGLMVADLNQTQRINNALNDLFGSEFEQLGQIYLVDPFGNLMMYYSGEASAYSIKADLKRLLKVSRAG